MYVWAGKTVLLYNVFGLSVCVSVKVDLLKIYWLLEKLSSFNKKYILFSVFIGFIKANRWLTQMV